MIVIITAKYSGTVDNIIGFTDFLISQDLGFTLYERFDRGDFEKNVTILKNGKIGKYYRFVFNSYRWDLICDIIPLDEDPKTSNNYYYGMLTSSLKWKCDITWSNSTLYLYKVNDNHWGLLVENGRILFGVTTANNVFTNEKEFLLVRPGFDLTNKEYEEIGKPDTNSLYDTNMGDKTILRNSFIMIRKDIILDYVYNYVFYGSLEGDKFYTIGENIYYKPGSDNFLVRM